VYSRVPASAWSKVSDPKIFAIDPSYATGGVSPGSHCFEVALRLKSDE
jgi:hypothetical protein